MKNLLFVGGYPIVNYKASVIIREIKDIFSGDKIYLS